MAQNKVTIIAQLVDHLTGPTKRAEKAVEDLGRTSETAGKRAATGHDKAAKAAEAGARKTTNATGRVDRALEALTGSTRRVGQAWDRTWQGTEKGPQRAARALSTAGAEMVTESRTIGRKVGDNLRNGIQAGVNNIDVSGVAAALGGLTIGGGVMGSLSRGTDASRIAAAEGADAGAVRALTEGVYGAGYGRDYESVSTSAGSVIATFDIEPGSPEAERLLSGTATLDEVFELGPDQLTMAARIIADNDEISGTAAQDILGAALQNATAAGRDEMLDNLQEYVPLLNDTGISAAALATMLSGATGRGAMASDRTGDAIKEFSVRAIDTGSKPISEAYSSLGLDQADISRRLQSGDATAFTDVTQALAGVTDQAEQARLAIELFGTPIEDLGVGNIDDQIDAWTGLDLTMSNAEGTIGRMQDTLQDDPGREWQIAMRDLSGAMIDVGDAVAPLISAVAPVISLFAKPLAWGVTGLTLFGIISRLPGGAAAAKWALSGLWRVLGMSPLGRLAVLLVAAVDGLGELYDKSETARAGFDAVSDSIRDLIGLFDDLLGKADDWASKKLGLENEGGPEEARAALEADIRPQWWKDAMRPIEETVGWGPQAIEGQGWMRIFQGSQDDEDLPHHADGGWTASGAHKAVLGEQGREFVINNWASEKLASVPGALPAIRQGRLPAVPMSVPVGVGGGDNVTINVNGVTDPYAVAAVVRSELANRDRQKNLTHSTLTARGAR